MICLVNIKAYDEMLKIFPHKIGSLSLRKLVDENIKSCCLPVDEIRLRTNKPLSFVVNNTIRYITSDSGDKYILSKEDILGVYRALCENSLYAYIDEIKNGFITIKGGHRVGFVGRVIRNDEKIVNIKDINSINIRIAREIKGCARAIYDILPYKIGDMDEIKSALIISPPGGGKTTVLRDLTRLISDGGKKVGVVDDRCEISAMYSGMAQNDIGKNTDVIENSGKSLGIEILMRTMSPNVIVTDEIVSEKDVEAICMAHGSGVAIIASVHGNSFDEILNKPIFTSMFMCGVFKVLIRISGREDGVIKTEVKYL